MPVDYHGVMTGRTFEGPAFLCVYICETSRVCNNRTAICIEIEMKLIEMSMAATYETGMKSQRPLFRKREDCVAAVLEIVRSISRILFWRKFCIEFVRHIELLIETAFGIVRENPV